MINSKKIQFSDLPEILIENDIFPYLTSKELFYSVKCVSTEWFELTRNLWSGKIKDEMIDTVKSLDFIYEKELYTKTYEFKMKFLLNYRNLLTAYHVNSNILVLARSLLSIILEPGIKHLLMILFSFCELHVPYVELLFNNLESDTLINYLNNEDNCLEFRNRMLYSLAIDSNFRERDLLNIFKDNFAMLNKESLENISESAKIIYSYLQGLLEYQNLKLEVKELREKIENLINRIQDETSSWPKKKEFFEKAYKLLLFSKCSSKNVNFMMSLFEQNKIRHTLVDYNDEAIKLIFDLKEKLHSNTLEIENLNEIIFENILTRRILLTKKILIMEKFYSIYKESKTNEEFVINGEHLNLKQLLWCLKFSSNSEAENVTKESTLKTKYYLDKNFDYDRHVILTNEETQRPRYTDSEYRDYEMEEEVEEAEKEMNNVLKTKEELRAEEEIKELKKEKQRLENQKERTEQILHMIKKFMTLKEHMENNKKKYKLILYILSKVRKGELNNFSQEGYSNILHEIDLNQLDLIDDDIISESERNELLNFENSESIMKDIEENILRQIRYHLEENKDKHIPESEN
jgi:hypothetical protein